MHVNSKANAAAPKLFVHTSAGKWRLNTACMKRLDIMNRTIAAYKLAPATIRH